MCGEVDRLTIVRIGDREQPRFATLIDIGQAGHQTLQDKLANRMTYA
jgi:hypothetical protein